MAPACRGKRKRPAAGEQLESEEEDATPPSTATAQLTQSPRPAAGDVAALTVADVARMEKEAIGARQHINHVVRLLFVLETAAAAAPGGDSEPRPPQSQAVVAAYQSLHRIFAHYICSGSLSMSPAAPVPSASLSWKWRSWLQQRYAAYVRLSLAFLLHPEAALQLSALHSLLALVRLQCEQSAQSAASLLQSGLFAAALSAAVASSRYCGLHDALMQRYLTQHADLQLYALRIIRKTLLQPPSAVSEETQDNALSLLLAVSEPGLPPPVALYVAAAVRPLALRAALSACWLSLLSRRQSVARYRRLLEHTASHVLPSLSSPLLLADFLSDSFGIGGGASLLALHALFVLISQHGLDYPRFYHRLYSLCTPALCFSRHRHRFLSLLSLFLSSPYVPSVHAAAFAKRLSRLALSAGVDSAGKLLLIVDTLLRRHASLLQPMIGGVDELRQEQDRQQDSLTSFLVNRQRELAEQATRASGSRRQYSGRTQLDDDDDDYGSSEHSDSLSDGRDAAASSGPLDSHRLPALQSASAPAAASGSQSSASAAASAAPVFSLEPLDSVTAELNAAPTEASTLWELRTLCQHYAPPLAALARGFFVANRSKQELQTEDWDGLSYGQLRQREMERRKRQKVPISHHHRSALFSAEPHSLFSLSFTW